MKLYFTEHFIKSYEKLPSEIQEKADKQLEFLLQNPVHPSLRVKKIKGTGGRIFEARVSRNYRFTFEMQSDVYILRKIETHEILQKP